MATTLNNIGVALNALGDTQQTLDFFQQALPLLQEVGDSYIEAITRLNIALILWNRGSERKRWNTCKPRAR